MTTFNVKEMTCGMCVKHVTKAVQAIEPGAEVKIDLATGKVEVSPSPKDPRRSPRRSRKPVIPPKSPRDSDERRAGAAMTLTSKPLAGKTLFITGASRGIGLAIALRAARDGANIAVAAKSETEHAKLPGTIYTAAAQIEEAGGKAFAVPCDIRFDEQVSAAIAKTVRNIRRRRHSRQQRQCDRSPRNRNARHEAVRSHASDQRARNVIYAASSRFLI